MASIEIKTSDPRMAAGIAEGAATVALRTMEAENRRLKAVDGVRRQGDDRRWQSTQRRLARKYSTEPVGRLHGAILGVWALLWMVLLGMTEFAVRGARK